MSGENGISTGATAGMAPEAVARPGRIRWTRGRIALVALAALVILPLAAQVRYLVWDVFDEGRHVLDAVVTISESLVGEFSGANATEATFSTSGPSRCAHPLPWAPNRVSFEGGAGLWIAGQTDIDAVFDHVSAMAEGVGLTVSRRDTTTLRLRSGKRTEVTIHASAPFPPPQPKRDGATIDSPRTPEPRPERRVSISFGSRCFPRPAGYRGGSFEAARALIDDWSGLVGFKSGPLSEARVR